jgi:hypothetical protein
MGYRCRIYFTEKQKAEIWVEVLGGLRFEAHLAFFERAHILVSRTGG